MAITSATLEAIDAAIEACAIAIVEGSNVAEYEIGGRRKRIFDPASQIEKLMASRDKIAVLANRATAGSVCTLGTFARG